MAKKDGSGSSGTKKKNSKKNSKKAGLIRVLMKSQSAPPKDNPFETIWSRRKFDILGKKRKGEERRVGLARSRAIEKRKKTLLKEYEQSGKASQFVDKRIGEQNDALNDFDKLVLRSQRERKVKSEKKYKYNLSEGEEDELDIEDGGFFSGRDDYSEEIAPEDDDDDDAVRQGCEKRWAIRERSTNDLAEEDGNKFVEGMSWKHVSPRSAIQTRKKTEKEIYLEVIQKSKHFKDLKRMENEEKEQRIEELEKNFKSLVQSEALVSLTHPGKIDALKALVNPGAPPEEQYRKNRESFSVKSAFPEQERPDAYDRLFNEMKLEARAKGSDRKKTDEEIAEEERERLEQLEQERQQRMLASPGDNSDEDDDGDDMGNAEKLSSRKARPISGDDLGDSFTPDEKQGKQSSLVNAILAGKDVDDSDDGESDEDDEEGSGEENEEETDEESEGGDNKIETLKEWEQSDDELVNDLASDKEEEDEDMNHEKVKSRQQEIVITAKSIKKQETVVDFEKGKGDAKLSLAQQRELPYVIEAPSSMADLCSLLENRSNKEIFEAIKRIRLSNAIALAAENRKKMQVFYGLLLQYFATVANKTPLNFELLNLLVKPLMEMSVEIPYFSAICARERLLRTRTQLSEDAKDPEKSCWPSLKTLLLLRLWSMTYPCSDFRHTVMTPAILLMCEYLMRCRILSGRDVAIGSLLCSMLLSVCKQSQKFCPEALMFLKSLLTTYLNKDLGSFQDSRVLPHLLELKASRSLLCIKNSVDVINPVDFLHIMNLPEDSSYFSSDGFRASILKSVVETLRGFVDIYRKLNAFPELFMPISKLSADLAKQQNMVGPLLDKLRGLVDLIKGVTDEHHDLRQPIQMAKKKPPTIQLLTPKYEDNFIKGRDYDPNRERAETRKLKKLLKEERKGAIRELKKDNTFLHELKDKERAQREEERAEKYGKALAFLQEQEHAAKSGQLGKGRKRRR